MKKTILLAVFIAFGPVMLGRAADAGPDTKTIYAAFWRGCEEACQGLQDYIAAAGIDAEVVIRDAGQDKTLLPGLLQEARDMDADVIVTWGTSVTLGFAGTLDDVGNPDFNNDIPQVFMVVADPVGARVIESLEKTNRPNITGTFNRVPEAVNINSIRSYDPSFKRLGLLYNVNEPNSVLKRDEMAGLASDMAFELVAIELQLDDAGRPNVNDIPLKVAELRSQGVDFIYLGSSSFLDANRDAFTGAAVAHGLPVLSPYERLVRDSDALFSVAARYTDVGRLAGQQVEKILVDGIAPGDLPVAAVTEFAYVVNMDVARKLNLYPPVGILQFAETVD